jgi:hypothetical protein
MLVEAQVHGEVGDIDEVARLTRTIARILFRKFPCADDFGFEGDDVNAIEAAGGFFEVVRRVGYGRIPVRS